MYSHLYDEAVNAVRRFIKADTGSVIELESTDNGPAAISYNLAMTASAMAVCPRRSDTATLNVAKDDSRSAGWIGPIALNGTVLAGTLMVKTEEEWDVLRRDETKLSDLLRMVGIPPENGRADTHSGKI